MVKLETSVDLGVTTSDDEFSLLEEEILQLSVKSSIVQPKGVGSLICSIWTKKSYHTSSFGAQIKSI